MTTIQELAMLGAVIVLGVSALGAGVAYWARRQNIANGYDVGRCRCFRLR